MNNNFSVSDFLIVLLTIALLFFALTFLTGCTTSCTRKTCCPMVGHGPCPICEHPIIYGRKNILN